MLLTLSAVLLAAMGAGEQEAPVVGGSSWTCFLHVSFLLHCVPQREGIYRLAVTASGDTVNLACCVLAGPHSKRLGTARRQVPCANNAGSSSLMCTNEEITFSDLGRFGSLPLRLLLWPEP